MIDQAVTNGWRVTGLYRRVGKAPGKSAALSLTFGNKQTELTIRIRWRKREESATEPIRKDLILLKRFKPELLGPAVQCADDLARLLDNPSNLEMVIKKLRESDPDSIRDKKPAHQLADFHHEALQELIDADRPRGY